MIELLINGELITGIDEVRMTKAVNDLGDLPSRQGEFSVTIDVPPTKSNCLALGIVEHINNVNKVYNQRNTYELYESGVLVSNGTARILNVKESIQIVLLSNNSDWLSLISDKNLRELNLRENDYSLISSEVAARRLQTTKMCLPNVYYGFKDPLKPYDTFDFKPCFFVSYLVEKIFSEIGYTLINLMNSQQLAIYNKMITIPTDEWLQHSYVGVAYKGSIANSPGWNATELWVGGDKFFRGQQTIPWGYPVTGKGSSITPLTGIEIIINFRRPKSIKGFIELNFTANQTTPQFVEVYLWDFITSTKFFNIGEVDVTNSGLYRIDFDFDISQYPFPDKFMDAFLRVDVGTFGINGVGNYDIVGGEIVVYDDGFNLLPQRENPNFEIVADTVGCLPDLSQSDLLLTVVNQFSLLFTTNTLTSEITMFPLQTVIDNIPNAVDWSDKVDLTEPHEVIFDFFDNYFQRNWFRYKNDENDPLINFKEIGDSWIDFDNQNLPATGNIFESEFAPIERTTVSGVQVAQSLFYPSESLNPKLGISTITNDNLITQFGQSAPTQSNEVFFNDISFSNLLPLNYGALERILKNNTVIKIQVRLTRSDFANMDFTKPVFLDVITDKGQIRGHFYVNQINQYNVGANDSCEVTLIQID